MKECSKPTDSMPNEHTEKKRTNHREVPEDGERMGMEEDGRERKRWRRKERKGMNEMMEDEDFSHFMFWLAFDKERHAQRERNKQRFRVALVIWRAALVVTSAIIQKKNRISLHMKIPRCLLTINIQNHKTQNENSPRLGNGTLFLQRLQESDGRTQLDSD